MSDHIVMDPLKLGTYGAKAPLEQKQGKIQNLHENAQRYYPVGRQGNLDEWGAVIKHQGEAWERQQQENAIKKAADAANYHSELTKAIEQKKSMNQVEDMKRAQERKQMLDQVAMKGMQEQMDYANYRNYQAKFGEQFKNSIDVKNSLNNQQKMNEKQFDADMVQRDRIAADAYNKNYLAQKAQAQDILKQGNFDAMQQKRIADELAKAEAGMKVGTTIQQLGDGYPAQRDRMQQADKLQERMYHNYLGAVGSPERQRQISEAQNQGKSQQEAMLRMDAAAGFVQEQQLRQRMDNQDQLIKQMQDNEFAKKSNEMAVKNYQTAQVQKHINQNAIINQGVLSAKQEQINRYKNELDTQKAQNDAFKMYGNMTQHEKRINKDELKAWKEYDNQQYSMIPGLQHEKKFQSNKQPGQAREASPKQTMKSKMGGAGADIHTRDVDRMANQGFHHLRKSGGLGNSSSAQNLGLGPPVNAQTTLNNHAHLKGRGGLLHGAIPLSSHGDMQQASAAQAQQNAMDQIVRHDGQSLNAAVRYDGSIKDEINGHGLGGQNIGAPHQATLQAPIAPGAVTGGGRQYQSGSQSALGVNPDGSPQYGNLANKRFSTVNQANGGVGVTYSNVSLGGGLHAQAAHQGMMPISSYQQMAVQGSPPKGGIQDHRLRFVSNSVQAEAARNPYAYVKGVDFNSQQKYDYNVISGVPLPGASAAGKGGNLGVVAQPNYNGLTPNQGSTNQLINAGAQQMQR